jgi:chromosome segregation ATPase
VSTDATTSGATMAERGVSQLVSVTLAEAERVIAAE